MQLGEIKGSKVIAKLWIPIHEVESGALDQIRNRSEKQSNLGRILDYSWTKVQEELNRCDLLCFNCHMEIEDDYEWSKLTNNN